MTMMKKRIFTALCAAAITLSMASCGNGNNQSSSPSSNSGSSDGGSTPSSSSTESSGEESGNSRCSDPSHVWDPYTPYEETVTFTKGLTKSSGGENFPEGDSYMDNDYTRYVLERINVQPDVAWEVDSNNYDQKVALSISTGDIPDIMVVNRTIYKQLLENDLIWDLEDAIQSCLSPTLMAYYDSFGDRIWRQVRVDGHIYGLPGTQLEGQHNLLWIRQDWLDELKLEVPKTLDEIEAAARAFVGNDMSGDGKTVGFAAVETVYGGYNSQHGMYSVFNAYDAYPGQWIEVDGKVVYGSTQPEMKDALQRLNNWYSEGLLDKEFAVRKGADREALIGSGQCGIMFGPWWGWGGVPESVTNNPDADWNVVSAPLDNAGNIHLYAQDPLNGILVVSKKFEHPEAIIKALNASYEVLKGFDEGKEAYEAALKHSPNMGWGVVPVALQIGPENALEVGYNDWMPAVEKEDPSLITQPDSDRVYETIMRERENPRADVYNWQEAFIRTVGTEAAIDPNRVVRDVVFYGTTETMSTKWTNLKDLETSTLVKIIMGEAPIEEFDNFVETWNKMGGEEITAEVQAEVDSMK